MQEPLPLAGLAGRDRAGHAGHTAIILVTAQPPVRWARTSIGQSCPGVAGANIRTAIRATARVPHSAANGSELVTTLLR